MNPIFPDRFEVGRAPPLCPPAQEDRHPVGSEHAVELLHQRAFIFGDRPGMRDLDAPGQVCDDPVDRSVGIR